MTEREKTDGDHMANSDVSNPEMTVTSETETASLDYATASRTDDTEQGPDLVTGEADEEQGKTRRKPNSNQHTKPVKNKWSGFKIRFSFAWLMILVLCVAMVISIGGGYANYKKIRTLRQTDEAQRINHDTLSTEVDELRQLIKQTEAQNQQLLAQLNASARERQSIQDTLEKLSIKLAEKGRGPLQWRLAEVDYLLSIANQRVMLQRDVVTAIKALTDADARLDAISDPALIPVRQKIAGEITALKSVDLPDIASYAIKLDGLVENIEKLPLINKEHILNNEKTQDGPVDDWRELPKAMWKDIKSLVTIRRTQEPVERLLPPEEIHYLYQNLALKLEEARIALLQQNTKVFQQHLTDTKSWVQRYFASESAAVTTVISTLEEMESQDLKPPLPDISGSLRALREWTSTHGANSSAAVTLQPEHLASSHVGNGVAVQ